MAAQIKNRPDDPSVERGVVTIADGGAEYHFRYATGKEMRRAERIFEKEPGTVAWIRKELKPGDVFYDIGANIGVYTILAGAILRSNGRIVAFEPHTPNAASLIDNIFLNGIDKITRVVTSPLTARDGLDLFHYFSMQRGSSTSQFGRTESETEAFDPVFAEIKYGVSIDSLLAAGFMAPPSLIKIDVDGLELEVLEGMRRLLHGPHRPRSVQCEIGDRTHDAIMAFFAEAGYEMSHKHWTKAGIDSMASGETVGEYPFYYAIFFAK